MKYTVEEIKLIAALKRNCIVFGENTPAMQAVFRKVGIQNCEQRMNDGWVDGVPLPTEFANCCTYRIKEDYEPKPIYEECELYVDSSGNFLMYRRLGKNSRYKELALRDSEYHHCKDKEGRSIDFERARAGDFILFGGRD